MRVGEALSCPTPCRFVVKVVVPSSDGRDLQSQARQ